MNGMLQASFFFGYVFMVSYAFSLMLGAVSYWMAQKFVRYIYARIHVRIPASLPLFVHSRLGPVLLSALSV
jgi:hypothetical protein